MDLSIVIPARCEMFLGRTIQDLLENIRGETEIIVILDGERADPPIPEEYLADPRLKVIDLKASIGQRAATNLGVRYSTAKYIMKVDAHCAFDQGFDVKLMSKMEDNWTVVPIMRNLHAFNWVCEKCGNVRYQGNTHTHCFANDKKGNECGGNEVMDVVWIAKKNPESCSFCFDPEPHFQYFKQYNGRPEGKGELTETMSLQGSCFMLTRDKYWELNICDEEFGSWGSQGIEVAMKTRLSGGKIFVNHNTWYAHLFRTQASHLTPDGKPGDFGFPYVNPGHKVQKAKAYARDIFFNNKWEKQIYPLSSVIEEFWPIDLGKDKQGKEKGWTDKDYINLKQLELKCERSGIFSIYNKVSGKLYIEGSANMSKSFSKHLGQLHSNSHDNKYLQSAWNKYGGEKFNFNIERFCSTDELANYEQQYITAYKQELGWKSVYNPEPTEGLDPTDEAIERVKKSITNRSKMNLINVSRDDLPPTVGLIYYTDNQLDKRIMHMCQKQIKRAAGDKPIISASLQKIDFGTKNIVIPMERGHLAMATQILAALEALDTDIVFFTEHDVLYHTSHFKFVPPEKDKYYYNMNSWLVRYEDGHAIYFDHKSLSGLVAYRETLIEHFKKRVAAYKKILAEVPKEKQGKAFRAIGFEPGTHDRAERIDDLKAEGFNSEFPNIDIKHDSNFTPNRWSQDQFRDKRNCENWKESNVWEMSDEAKWGWKDLPSLVKPKEG